MNELVTINYTRNKRMKSILVKLSLATNCWVVRKGHEEVNPTMSFITGSAKMKIKRIIMHTNPVNINVRFHCHLIRCPFISYIAYVDQTIDLDELSKSFICYWYTCTWEKDKNYCSKKYDHSSWKNLVTNPLKESETISCKVWIHKNGNLFHNWDVRTKKFSVRAILAVTGLNVSNKARWVYREVFVLWTLSHYKR